MIKHILRNDIEYIIHSDSSGKIIGPISATHAHREGVRETLTHYSTWSMIYHQKTGKYGIQLKNPKKNDKYGAGKWDMGVAGHNCYLKERGFFRPLGFDENLIKEAREEIGINIKMFKSKDEFTKIIKSNSKQPVGFIFEKFHYKTEINNEWVGLGFIVVPSTQVIFNDNEVVDFKWFSPEELKEYLKTDNNYCSPLPLVFEKAEKFRKNVNF
ncbi:MAG: NUDIX domain-containing protein [bacterium]